MVAWLILVHVGLAAAAALYAAFLNQRHVYEWYTPEIVTPSEHGRIHRSKL